MYEVMLSSNGVMQFGWCTQHCSLSGDDGVGVGDTANSYAYDGARERCWWNEQDHHYGEPWSTGDVIGCCFDCDAGTMTFYRSATAFKVLVNGSIGSRVNSSHCTVIAKPHIS